MFCTNCGNKIDDGSKFCPDCGAKLTAAEEAPVAESADTAAPAPVEAPVEAASSKEEAAPVQSPVQSAPAAAVPAEAASAPSAKKPSKVAVVGMAAVGIVAAVVVVAVLFIAGVFTGPSGKVGAAFEKTFKAYEAAYDELGGFDAAALLEGKKYSQSATLTIGSLEGDDTYEGLGVRANLDIDIPGQSVDVLLTPFYESADIASVQAGLDGTKLYAVSKELTDGKFYGIDTATLGKDVAELSGDDSVESLSFNVFEIAEALDKALNDKDSQKAAEAAAETFLKSIEVKKTGKEEIDVNDNTVKATAYEVVIPVDAVEDYLKALENAVDTDKLIAAFVDILESMGLPDEIVDDFADELTAGFEEDASYDEISYLLDGMDDIELTVFVSGGLVAAIEYTGEFEGEKIVAGLYLGGGENYVDDLSFVFEVKGEYGGKLVLSSNGDHGGKSGVFTDKTKLTMKESGSERETLFASELEYSKKDGAFELEMDIADEVNLRAEGTMKMDKKSFELVCSELVCTDTYWEEEAFDIALGYSIGAYKRAGEKAGSVAMILTMDEDELEALGEEIAENAEEL
ncbi:MAG: zinc-ribbon domain-containing protein, partial [Oscillospiraceae bacterium]|nr:zinc-ribbon domain-containing protein [Oscillospiraceae bacterium]